MEYYVEQLIALNSTIANEEQKQYSQRVIDRFVEREQEQKEVRQKYYELQSQMNALLNNHPELKELE
jgi:hypothetical protein